MLLSGRIIGRLSPERRPPDDSANGSPQTWRGSIPSWPNQDALDDQAARAPGGAPQTGRLATALPQRLTATRSVRTVSVQREGLAMATTRAAKSQRIEVRATERQEAILRQAAAATDRTMTDFILASAVELAERILAERRWFTGTTEQYDEFLRLLDEPLESTEKFEKMWSRPSPFGQPFTPTAR